MTTPILQRPALREGLSYLLERGRQKADRHRQPVLVSVAVDIPSFDPLRLFQRARAQERILWERPEENFGLVAIGAAARLTGQGPARFSRVTREWTRLVSLAVRDEEDGGFMSAPVCLGGFSFDTTRRKASPWKGYPDALLIVPRLLFASWGRSSRLIVSVMATPHRDPEEIAAATAEEVSRLLTGEAEAAPEKHPAGEVASGGFSLEDRTGTGRWKETVAAVVRDIRRGAVEKLVLARQVRGRIAGPLDLGPVLARLRSGFPGCTIFAYARGDACFLGATPERLVRLDDRTVRADCLAGSAARGSSAEEDRALSEALLADGKERHEHALVVRALRDALEPLCASLTVPETPDILRVPNVQHLHTPITGLLDGRRHILDLVERLHPTPATAGLPRQAALSLIHSYEPFDRGWYAGPVGWVDGRGSGEFAVAIRSALIQGREAFLYAGCGIVSGSDPEREYAESCLKLKPMLRALDGREAQG